MHDTSHVIKNSVRLGGSSGRISKTTPLGAWYDLAVSVPAQAVRDIPLFRLGPHARMHPHPGTRAIRAHTAQHLDCPGVALVRHHRRWLRHVRLRLRTQPGDVPGHCVRRQNCLLRRARSRRWSTDPVDGHTTACTRGFLHIGQLLTRCLVQTQLVQE